MSQSFDVIQPLALSQLQPRPRVIDVREPAEFTGELGHIPGAELVPLATVESAAKDWPRDAPLVVACRSGARSAKAAATLVGMGFTKVTNLEGGTQGYGAAGLPVEGANASPPA